MAPPSYAIAGGGITGAAASLEAVAGGTRARDHPVAADTVAACVRAILDNP